MEEPYKPVPHTINLLLKKQEKEKIGNSRRACCTLLNERFFDLALVNEIPMTLLLLTCKNYFDFGELFPSPLSITDDVVQCCLGNKKPNRGFKPIHISSLSTIRSVCRYNNPVSILYKQCRSNIEDKHCTFLHFMR